jgi:hypothetical protein
MNKSETNQPKTKVKQGIPSWVWVIVVIIFGLPMFSLEGKKISITFL